MPDMRDLRNLVEALPECEPKGRLRGLATAATVVDGEHRAAILERMADVVRQWQRSSPVAELGNELHRQIGRPSR